MGDVARVFHVENDNIKLRICELGASLLSCKVRVGDGFVEVLRGEPDPASRTQTLPYYNAIIGRCANRIANSCYEYNGQVIHLEPNEGNNHLHGASAGLHRASWQGERLGEDTLVLRYSSPSGASGYPGNLSVAVRYRLLECRIEITMLAEVDEPSPVNLTHHNYFNLSPEAETVLEHKLQINASSFTPVDSAQIPTGEIQSLDRHPMDLRQRRLLKDVLEALPAGLDDNFVLNRQEDQPAAVLQSPDKTLSLKLFTDLPGLQVYTCNQEEALSDGTVLPKHFAVCLEPQYFPDAVNHANFDSPLLQPGEQYKHFIRYDFSTGEDVCST